MPARARGETDHLVRVVDLGTRDVDEVDGKRTEIRHRVVSPKKAVSEVGGHRYRHPDDLTFVVD